MIMPGNEDQKVAEWAESFGLRWDNERNHYCGVIAGNSFYLTAGQATFFYKERQADRKRLLDKVTSDVLEPFNSRADKRVALDQIRKEEL